MKKCNNAFVRHCGSGYTDSLTQDAPDHELVSFNSILGAVTTQGPAWTRSDAVEILVQCRSLKNLQCDGTGES